MKRSIGVTALGILLIVSGAIMALSNVATGFSGEASVRRWAQQADALEAKKAEYLRQAQTQGQSAEALAQAEAQVDQAAAVLRRVADATKRLHASPMLAAVCVLSALLGVAALAAGIGVLKLAGWGRSAAIWQAIASVPFGLWSIAVFSPFYRELTAMVSGLTVAADGDAQVQQVMQMGQAAGMWIGIIWLLGWNAFVVWFFNRTSAKAQFSASA